MLLLHNPRHEIIVCIIYDAAVTSPKIIYAIVSKVNNL